MLLMKWEQLKELLDEKAGPCVSVYMPTVKGSIETRQNPIRYRKLLRDAARKLSASGMKPGKAREFLSPAHQLLEDSLFWQYQMGGLAAFLSPRIKRVYTLPLEFSEMAAVGGRFCVRQLLPLFAEDGRFCVLAISQRSVKLYQCSRYSVSEVDLRRAPKSIYELLEFNSGEKQLQFHARTEGRASGRGRPAMFHGSAEDTDESKENILVYFQNVNRAINSLLKSSGGPLVLAGVDYLTRIYGKANTYPRLCEGRIAGNPAELGPDELRNRGWELVRPGFEAGARAAVAEFRQLRDTPKASDHLETVLQAAGEGRVAVLFVSSREQRWGMFDRASGAVSMHARPDLCDMELLELCAARTLDHGGQVYALEEDRMPCRAPAGGRKGCPPSGKKTLLARKFYMIFNCRRGF